MDKIDKAEELLQRAEKECEKEATPRSESFTIEEILNSVEKVLPGKKDMVLIALAVSISHHLDHKTPIWLMFVGAPSSAKTEVVRLLNYNPEIKFLDSLTDNAFISGARNKDGSQPTDLLPLLDKKCFIIKDFTTTLSQREESVRKILGDLTSIYDDTFTKHSPSRGTIEYHSFFPIMTCVTPQALNNHQRYMNQIGPRFLFYRSPSPSDKETNEALDIAWKSKSFDNQIKEARQKVSAYSCQVKDEAATWNLDEPSTEVKGLINNMAKFVARARGIVLTRASKFRNEDDEEVVFYEVYEKQVEEPHRAVRQLKVLANALAVVLNQTKITNEVLTILRKVVLSSMPADRSALISIIAKENKKWQANEVAKSLGISHKTALRQLDELVTLEILGKEEQGNGLANNYFVVPIFQPVVYFGEEFMSSLGTETQTPQLFIGDEIFLEEIEF